MDERQETLVRRRDLLRAVTTGVTMVAASGVSFGAAAAAPVSINEKRRARYQANSAEVQDFYRINRYPAQ
ncbi:hypothetical protein SAMN05444161_8428 [Rhizobiales bacterium GAS191]|nr:hypothetical protein SAMN05444161_8428 [Rhizobiales bacterium GAS191]